MPKKISQPEINIGLVGHVDHGKTTLVSRLSGKWTDTHSEEKKKGITIRLGYANSTFYKCKKCKDPECYSASSKCPKCKGVCEQLRTVSFVDAPGHETLMATMLSGSAIMDAAILLVAADEECPQPQTKEHLMALEIAGIKNIIIVQNKIDLVSNEDALKNYKEIQKFVKGSIAEKVPIIPISAQHNINIDFLIKTIEETFKTPKRDQKSNPKMFLARSFDVNRPGVEIPKVVGGVLGGSLIEGKLKVGDKVEIKPGRKIEKEGKVQWLPIETEIIGIKSGNDDLKEAIPGGSIAVLTKLDPSYVKSDKLSGNILGLPGKLPEAYIQLELVPKLLERVVGSEKELKVDPVKKGEVLMLTVNASATAGVVTELSKNAFKINLKLPVCADKKDKLTISRRVGHRFRLIGYGTLK
ncbi:translation initiation factor IF-2 subunit gamma [archaeon]|jgi:translation initiation factor 2 subunit 3|nr:translation initiation factor IF-2 subunit gamma [archaeon]MBT4397358.1 translation initiation factor IF-2 subunit gamma [archaeon]MBT4440738.1 translation initiation factor IF-2 subunit gamma [archaeon]